MYSTVVLLSDLDIRAALGTDIVIDGFEDDMLQPASVELRLGEQFALYDASTDVLDPIHLDAENLNLTIASGIKRVQLAPGQFILGHTAEVVRLSGSIAARVEGKSTLGRLGLMVHSTAGFIDPGFHGQITLEIKNINSRPIRLYAGMRIAQLGFYRINPVERPYGSAGLGSHYQAQLGVGMPRALRQ